MAAVLGSGSAVKLRMTGDEQRCRKPDPKLAVLL